MRETWATLPSGDDLDTWSAVELSEFARRRAELAGLESGIRYSSVDALCAGLERLVVGRSMLLVFVNTVVFRHNVNVMVEVNECWRVCEHKIRCSRRSLETCPPGKLEQRVRVVGILMQLYGLAAESRQMYDMLASNNEFIMDNICLHEDIVRRVGSLFR